MTIGHAVIMFKFVDSAAGTYGRKGRESRHRACTACRRKKKRCTHVGGQQSGSQESSDSPVGAAQLPSSGPIQASSQHEGAWYDGHQHSICGPQQSASTMPEIPPDQLPSQSQPDERRSTFRSVHLSSITNGRDIDSTFIGDMNPEGIFLAATSPQDLRGGLQESSVGLWLAQQFNKPNKSHGQSWIAPQSSLFHGYTPAIQQVLLPVIIGDCLSTLPPAAHRKALCSIYLEKFHPIFPILDQVSYERLSEDNPSRVILEQGMILVACVDSSAEPHLLLADDGNLLGCKEFGRRLLAALRVFIEIGMVADKVVLMQALSLMSLFSGGRESREASSLIVGRAVQYLHSLGIHIPDRKDSPDSDYAETLFCCIWAIDRLNAAFQGKPVFMHERDIERSLQRCFAAQKPAFRLVLHIVEILDRVIELYRPGKNGSELEGAFCLFDDLILRCDASNIPTDQLATIETLYHAVAILSCRSQMSGSDSSASPTARTRQAFSTERVTGIVGHEHRHRLVLFPFVPYAISLSLSVSYREMRRSKIPMLRARARIAFEANCLILKELGEKFSSAAVMADMGNMTLEEVDRAYSRVTDESRRRQSIGLAGPVTGIANDLDNSIIEQSVDALNSNSATVQELHPFYFTEMPQLDPFAMFGPEFDLLEVDKCLEGSLDLGAPLGLPF